jgi:hypothetical protein
MVLYVFRPLLIYHCAKTTLGQGKQLEWSILHQIPLERLDINWILLFFLKTNISIWFGW